MNERQVRYQLRKSGYLLRKKKDGYIVIEGTYNFAVAGCNPPFSMSLDEVEEWVEEITLDNPSMESDSSGM